MSESITDTAPVEALQPALVTEAPDAQAPTEQAAEPTAEPEQQPKKTQGDRRFAILTAKLKAEESARHSAERERDAAVALSNAGRPEADRLAAPTRQAPQDIEAAAARLVQQREFDARRQAVVTSGAKEFSDWHERTEILHGLGATSNQHFMEALVETDNAAKIVAHLADDADALVALLGKSPAAMAAQLGRLDAQMSRPAARAISAAPPPSPRVQASGVVPEASPHNYPANMSMKAWNEMMNAHLPASLGGKKRPA